MIPAYLTQAARIEADLRAAIRAASSLLPEGIRMRQWMFAKHRPSQSAAWEDTYFWYYTQEEADDEILRVLLHLKLLASAYTSLTIVTQPVPTAEPDLSLPKVRRRYA